MHRRGFEELYVFSPGSQYQWYGMYAYVVVGPAMLEPVVLGPGDTWQGGSVPAQPQSMPRLTIVSGATNVK